jgi:hypothetical protein
MVDLVQQYDPEATGREDVPDGTYTAQIVESKKEPISKDKDVGDCLNLCWEVVEGPQAKRLIWQRLNLWWTGPEKTPGQVAKIANGQFADIRKATGVAIPNDSDELHFIPCLLTYGRQKNDERYGEVKSVRPLGGTPDKQVAPPRAANQAASSPPQQRAAGTAAWRR